LMSESLRNDGRIWVPKQQGDKRKPNEIPEEERDYYLERRYPAFGNLVPRDVASRAAKERCDAGYGVGSTGQAVYLDFKFNLINKYGKAEANKRGIDHPDEATLIALGKEVVKEEYGNLFDMYEKITGENPYEVPMRIYPAVHYTMGGLWVDYELMTTVKGLYALGEANFSDHGANRLGASALMQGLADGYFVIPYTMGNYLADDIATKAIPTDHPAFIATEKEVSDRINTLINIKGKQTVESFHKRLGKIMWEKCGMARNEKGLKEAITEIQELKKEFWSDLRIPGNVNEMNPELDKAGRVADFIELGELMCRDALDRNESCGGHFREESQTEEGEAKRDDEHYAYVAAWQYKGESDWALHKEALQFEVAKPTQRSYK
ncbi:MAG TPA: FAD-binding protein, partial [Chitinophagaceae bacterium]|nr:FAD-binding protein [Chitinophagaceae bacterium]